MTQQRPEVLSYERPRPPRENPQWWWLVRALPIAGSTLMLMVGIAAFTLPQRPPGPWYVLFWVGCSGLFLCLIGFLTSIVALVTRQIGPRRGAIGCGLAIGLPLIAIGLFGLMARVHPLG